MVVIRPPAAPEGEANNVDDAPARRMSDEPTDGRRHPPLGRLWQYSVRHAPSRLETALFGERTLAREAAVRDRQGRTWHEPADAVAWLLRVTGSSGVAYVRLDLEGAVASIVAPPGLADEPRAELQARARALFVSGKLGPHADEEGTGLTWYAGGALRALVATGALAEDPGPMARVREFLDAHREHEAPPLGDDAAAQGRPDAGPPRPRLLDVSEEDHGERARVTTALEWRGRSLVGSATGAATDEGRHRAAARAVVRALEPAVEAPLRMDRFRLISSGAVRLAVAAVRLDGRVLTGAATATPGEAWAGARAALAALNRELTRP
jgi:hypothetical protein